MLTQTVTITQNSTPNIIIGRRGTYETEQVVFDVSWLIDTYGAGSAVLMVHRPTDQTAYPVDVVLDGNTLAWTVSETDTQYKGHGECEIFWYVNDGLAKTCICGITILRDIGDTTETAPDPYETWVETLSRLGAETLTNAQAAAQSANDAAQSATEADNSAAAALESEENALNSENAAKASEQAAAASEQDAEQSAMAARQSATEAAQSATNANDDATNASASADRAEQAAASIEGDTERAEAAARTAQGAATSAQGSASTASTKATEAAGSAATAEQAANNATQQAADASASATAADGSASSASASATAAGNAQSAAETAQEAAETAAQSIEDSAAQIDANTADILNLKSALNTKAGILRDTVSGSVASFVPDATVPNLLGLAVNIEPVQAGSGDPSPDNVRPISGWESVEVEATGINIWDEEWEVGTLNVSTGANEGSGARIRCKNYIPVIPGKSYYMKWTAPSTGRGVWYDSNKQFISGTASFSMNQVVTVPDGAWFFKFSPPNGYGTTYNNDISINYPSTDHDYHPYVGTTHTIQLGETVYGGTLDALNGTLTVDRAMVDMGTLNWAANAFQGVDYFVTISAIPNIKPGVMSRTAHAICDSYAVIVTQGVTYSGFVSGTLFVWTNGSLYLRNSAFADAASLKASLSGVMLCYELATPIVIDLDPVAIATIANQTNNVWADAGDVAVEFAADLKTYIDNKIAAAVAALS